ncbi:MAG: hypothetical protein ACRCU1_01865 [Alsobacter sp.]
MRTIPQALAVALAAALVAGCGPTPQAPRSAAELVAVGPQRSADLLTAASLAFDLGRVAAGVAAAASCPLTDAGCDQRRKREALDATETEAGALALLVAAQHELAGPAGPRAIGPDLAGVCRRLGLACAPGAPAGAP